MSPWPPAYLHTCRREIAKDRANNKILPEQVFDRGLFQVASVGLPPWPSRPPLGCHARPLLSLSLSSLIKPCQRFHTLHVRFRKGQPLSDLLNNMHPGSSCSSRSITPNLDCCAKEKWKKGSTGQRVWSSSRRAKIDRYTSTATKSTIITDGRDEALARLPLSLS